MLNTLLCVGVVIESGLLSTCLNLKAGVVITVTELVDSGNIEGVDCPTFQIRYAAGGGGATTAGIMAANFLGQDCVTESSV